MHKHYNTAAHGETERYDFLQWALKDVCGDFEIHVRNRNDVNGEVIVRDVFGFEYADIHANLDKVTRGRRQIAQSNDQYCFLIYQKAGRAAMQQCGREAILTPGKLTLVDSAQPSTFFYGGGFHQLSLHVPRRSLEARLRSRSIPTAITIDGQSGIGAITINFLETLLAQNEALTPGQSELLQETLIDLALAALGCRDTTPAWRHLPETKRSQLTHLQNYIELRLADPTLSPARIAEGYGISTRHLHRLFQYTGETVGAWIRKRRLEKCRRDLADPNLAGHTILEIAFNWGFNDESHFGRAFKAAYGLSPRNYRTKQQ